MYVHMFELINTCTRTRVQYSHVQICVICMYDTMQTILNRFLALFELRSEGVEQSFVRRQDDVIVAQLDDVVHMPQPSRLVLRHVVDHVTL